MLVDVSEWGVGLQTGSPMVVGAKLRIWGTALAGAREESEARVARVMHCRMEGDSYRTGCAFDGAPPSGFADAAKADPSLTDYYEILQLSPAADVDTIHRVYRILAQRYHPDNPDSGDTRAFQNVLQAHDVLSDPEKRAAYDAKYHASRALRWRIFRKPQQPSDLETERRVRGGILQALYTKMRNDPNTQGMMAREFEDLLGCPSEHVRFPLWYLVKKGWIAVTDNGRYAITISGVDEAERILDAEGAPGAPPRAMIELPEARRESA